MNVDKNLKLLLLKLGMKGHDVTLTREQRYSREFNSVYARYKLTFWVKGKKRNKKTGEEKECMIPNTIEFKSAIEALKYMVVIANE